MELDGDRSGLCTVTHWEQWRRQDWLRGGANYVMGHSQWTLEQGATAPLLDD